MDVLTRPGLTDVATRPLEAPNLSWSCWVNSTLHSLERQYWGNLRGGVGQGGNATGAGFSAAQRAWSSAWQAVTLDC